MRISFFVILAMFGASAVEAQPSAMPEHDRIQLAEAFGLVDAVRDCIWPGWSAVPFAVLLVTPEYEFLVRHPRPSDDFLLATDYDSLLSSAVYVRDRQYPPNLLATFPAVGGVPTVVIGQAAHTEKTSTFWVITLLHEHFHQLQMVQPDYWDDVKELDLAGVDETGMWMLNYPFPYESAAAGVRFAHYRDALVEALASARGLEEDTYVSSFIAAKARFRDSLSDADYRYFSFQLWQEGVARYTEYRIADAAAELHEPLSTFEALGDFLPYSVAADSLRLALASELADLDLATHRRVAFYAVGAAEALLLDVVRPGWRRQYFNHPFYLERYLERR